MFGDIGTVSSSSSVKINTANLVDSNLPTEWFVHQPLVGQLNEKLTLSYLSFYSISTRQLSRTGPAIVFSTAAWSTTTRQKDMKGQV